MLLYKAHYSGIHSYSHSLTTHCFPFHATRCTQFLPSVLLPTHTTTTTLIIQSTTTNSILSPPSIPSFLAVDDLSRRHFVSSDTSSLRENTLFHIRLGLLVGDERRRRSQPTDRPRQRTRWIHFSSTAIISPDEPLDRRQSLDRVRGRQRWTQGNIPRAGRGPIGCISP
jgi:hypothetical protein